MMVINSHKMNEIVHLDKKEEKSYNCPLLNLNDDCLFKIMSYLNWVDSMNFAAVCPQPQYDILAKWRLRFVDFEWNDDRLSWSDVNNLSATLHQSKIVDEMGFTLVDFQWNNTRKFINIDALFSYLGPFISSLSISGTTGHDVTTIMNHCPLVKSLKLKYCLIEGDLLCYLNLEELCINNCYFEDVCWSGIKTLKRLAIEATASDLKLDKLLENNCSIEHIELSGSIEFNYSMLVKLEKLQSLQIALHDEIILNTITELTKLRKLKLCCSQYENVNRVLEKLGSRSNVPELVLEKLRFNCDTFNTLASTNIQSLILMNPEFHQHSDSSVLTTELSNSLAHISDLRLTINSISITLDDMMMLVRMKSLHELNLYECHINTIVDFPWIDCMQTLLDVIDKVLQKTEDRVPLILVMPKTIMLNFGKRFNIDKYSTNPSRLKIIKPSTYDEDYLRSHRRH